MLIYFIRHGETAWNKERRMQGRSDIPLNDYGRKLARITAAALSDIPFELIYTSPLLRAKETAQIMAAGRNLPVHEDVRLIEMGFGIGEGKTLEEIRSMPETGLYRFLDSPETYLPPEGAESFDELYARCQSFIKEVILPAEKTCQAMLVICHGALIRGMIHHITGMTTADFWKVTHYNCSATIASCDNGWIQLLEQGKIYYDKDVNTIW